MKSRLCIDTNDLPTQQFLSVLARFLLNIYCWFALLVVKTSITKDTSIDVFVLTTSMLKQWILVAFTIQSVSGAAIVEISNNATDIDKACSTGYFRCGGFGVQGVCCQNSQLCCPGAVFASCCAGDQQCMGINTPNQMCCLQGSRLCGGTCCLENQICDLTTETCMDHDPALQPLNKNLAHKFVVYSFISYCLPGLNLTSWDCFWCDEVPKVNIIATAEDADSDSYAFVGLNSAEKLIVVSFRGTCDYENILTDTNFIKTRPYPDYPSLEVHLGFYNSYSSISSAILKGVVEGLNYCPKCRIAIVGHSLGGALATLAAFDLSAIVEKKQLYVFTYGSPRVGNQFFAQMYGERVASTWRFVHAADPIPHLPGTDVNFWHVSTEMWIRNDTYIEQCQSVGEDPNCADSLYIWDYDYGLSDHRHYLGEYTKDACSC